MTRAALLAVAAVGLACSSKGASFEGAKLDTPGKPQVLVGDDAEGASTKKKRKRFGDADDGPPTRAPFTVSETRHVRWSVAQGLLVQVWHETGEGTSEEMRGALASVGQADPSALPNAPLVAIKDVDELTETANYLLVKRHHTMVGGVGMNERYLIARSADGKLHRWSATCVDILQEARCPPLLDSFALQKPADYSAP